MPHIPDLQAKRYHRIIQLLFCTIKLKGRAEKNSFIATGLFGVALEMVAGSLFNTVIALRFRTIIKQKTIAHQERIIAHEEAAVTIHLLSIILFTINTIKI
jgi:hypothetical protein